MLVQEFDLIVFLISYLQNKETKHFIDNHLAFTVKYHKDLETDSARIVGFEVRPYRLEFFSGYVKTFSSNLVLL